MALFQPKLPLPLAEKARLEFQYQRIAQHIGPDRLRLPGISLESLVAHSETATEPEPILHWVGSHWGHDVNDLRVEVVPQPTEQCGGGG